MADSEASAADAQREGKGPSNLEADITARKSVTSPSRKRKPAGRRHRRKRRRYGDESPSSESSVSSDSGESSNSDSLTPEKSIEVEDSDTSSSSESNGEAKNGTEKGPIYPSKATEYVRFKNENDSKIKTELTRAYGLLPDKTFSICIPDKILNETILDIYPVPSTSVTAPKWDSYVPEIFSAAGTNIGKSYD